MKLEFTAEDFKEAWSNDALPSHLARDANAKAASFNAELTALKAECERLKLNESILDGKLKIEREHQDKLTAALNVAREALVVMEEWVPIIRGWNPISRALALRDQALAKLDEVEP